MENKDLKTAVGFLEKIMTPNEFGSYDPPHYDATLFGKIERFLEKHKGQ